MTTGGVSESDNHRSSKKIEQLTNTINEHGKKMVSVAKMKVEQRDKELCYAQQAKACNSICALGSEKRQLLIQMLAEKEKNNTVMEKVYADVIAEIDQKQEQENVLLSTSTSTSQKSNHSPLSH